MPKNCFFLHFTLFYTLYDNAEKRISHSPLPNLSSVNKTRKVSYPEISRHYYPPPPTTGTREAQMELSGTIWNARRATGTREALLPLL